jgi:hypothetical protein
MTSIHPSSVQSTPGLEIPGAFPREHTATTRQHPLSDSRRASERPQRISLPSSEKEGTHPGEHSGGVGSLPGSISETSVAKLPDERASERKAAASTPASRSNEITADTDRGDDPSEAAALPSTEKEGAHPGEHSGGVGSLPGSISETSVAKLPDERASERKASASRSNGITADTDRGDDPSEAAALPSTEKEGAHPGEHSGGVGSLPGSISETSVAKLPDERASERKASASRSNGITADTDREDDTSSPVVAAVAPDSSPVPAKIPDKQASEASESASTKGLFAVTTRGDDSRQDVAAAPAATSSGAPVTNHRQGTSTVRRTEPQGPNVVGQQVPAAVRAAQTKVSPFYSERPFAHLTCPCKADRRCLRSTELEV